MPAIEETLSPGFLLDGRYRLERRLGVGGHGTVWLAQDESGRYGAVAIKLLSGRLAVSEDVRRRFRAEAVILRTLKHPGIIRALDYSADGPRLYIVMEYLAGRSLAEEMVDRVRRGESFRLDEVVRRIGLVCDAVAAAHVRGVVHRDLKPQNVLVVDADGDVETKVLDFGIAKVLARPGEDANHNRPDARLVSLYISRAGQRPADRCAGRRLLLGLRDVRAFDAASGLGRRDRSTVCAHRRYVVAIRRSEFVSFDFEAHRHRAASDSVGVSSRLVGGRRRHRGASLEVEPDARFATVAAFRDALSEVAGGIGRHLVADRATLQDVSLPRLPVVMESIEMPQTGLVPDFEPLEAEVDPGEATSLMPKSLGPTTQIMAVEAIRPRSVMRYVLLIVVGGMMGALAYYFVPLPAFERSERVQVVPNRRSSPPAAVARPMPVGVRGARDAVVDEKSRRNDETEIRADQKQPVGRAEPAPRLGTQDVDANKKVSSVVTEASRFVGAAGRRARRRPKPAAQREPVVVQKENASLWRELGALRTAADVARLEALATAIQSAAARLSDRTLAARIDRLASASLTTGDLDGIEQCLDWLEDAP